jgi:hypothetical protein
VGMKKGTRLTDNPKDIQIKLRADKKTVDDLIFCSEKLKISKSDVMRMGIAKIKQEIEEKK